MITPVAMVPVVILTMNLSRRVPLCLTSAESETSSRQPANHSIQVMNVRAGRSLDARTTPPKELCLSNANG